MSKLPGPIQRQLEQAEQAIQVTAEPAAEIQNPPPAEPVAEPAPPAQPAVNWEHKAKTLQGVLNAQAQQHREFKDQMNQELAQMKEQLRRVQEAAPPPPPPPQAEADQGDADRFGADTVEFVTRLVGRAVGILRAEMTRAQASLDGRLQALEQNVTGVTQQTAQTQEHQFFAVLEQLVPQWREINEDPAWHEWLGEADPVYGVPRQQALEAAHRRWDAKQTAQVFKAFIAETARRQPASPPQAPRTVAGAAAPAQAPAQQVRVFREKEIQEFYLHVAQGKYRNKQQEMAAIEAEINQAVAEGRVTR